MTQFQPGDRIISASNREGLVLEVDAQLFPLHTLVQFEDEVRPLLILSSCLRLDDKPTTQPKRGRSKKTA